MKRKRLHLTIPIFLQAYSIMVTLDQVQTGTLANQLQLAEVPI